MFLFEFSDVCSLKSNKKLENLRSLEPAGLLVFVEYQGHSHKFIDFLQDPFHVMFFFF